ncbi:hypothetical protein GCM10018787_36010 [Streptomyces thermodiastaticus]|nr:hypothetical protein GCM10018787_36010 [Streptomyces thermodiastaticus]
MSEGCCRARAAGEGRLEARPEAAPSQAAPKPVFPGLGNHSIDRAALGYASETSATNLTKGAQPSRATANGERDTSFESRT